MKNQIVAYVDADGQVKVGAVDAIFYRAGGCTVYLVTPDGETKNVHEKDVLDLRTEAA